MNKDDIAIYKSVQKNTEMAMKAIETIEPKVYENELALLLEKTNRQYADIHEKAVSGLQEAKIEPKKAGGLEQMMLVGGITGNTLFNTSTSHIAELMIKGSNMGILDLTKALNHNPNGGEKSMELANELMHMENRNLEEYKKYL